MYDLRLCFYYTFCTNNVQIVWIQSNGCEQQSGIHGDNVGNDDPLPTNDLLPNQHQKQ